MTTPNNGRNRWLKPAAVAPRPAAAILAGHPQSGCRPRCRMHGCAPGSGGPPGERNGMFRHGRYTRRTKELGALMRKLARDGEAMVARVMDAHGLKPPVTLR